MESERDAAAEMVSPDHLRYVAVCTHLDLAGLLADIEAAIDIEASMQGCAAIAHRARRVQAVDDPHALMAAGGEDHQLIAEHVNEAEAVLAERIAQHRHAGMA